MNLPELEMQWKKNATVRSRASGTDPWAITRYGIDDWLPWSIAILFMITTLLCCYVGDCSTLQGLVMALFIDWPERDGSFVFYNITSHDIDWAKYKSGKSRQWETRQCNHHIFNTSFKSKKYMFFYPTPNPGNRAARCDVRLVPKVPGQVLNGIRSTLRVGPPLYLLAWLC